MIECAYCGSKTSNKKFCCRDCYSQWCVGKTSEEIFGDEIGKRIREKKKLLVGSKNPMFGKKHSDKTKNIISRKQVESIWKYKTPKFRKRRSELMIGKNNPMYGKRIQDKWVEKYGESGAENRMKEFKEKMSSISSGEKNPMYGRPSPQGSGNGWSGWYKGWFFRSIFELSYMLNVIERFSLSWESAEQKEYRINYIDYFGNKRSYFADFIIGGKYMIECKPRKLINSPSVLLKTQAAIEFCKNIGIVFKIREPMRITTEEIKKMYDMHQIKFTDRYEKMFNNLIK